jgi:dihydropteroate synthase
VHVARHGVWCVRVHDVVATVDALDVVAALQGGPGPDDVGTAR